MRRWEDFRFELTRDAVEMVTDAYSDGEHVSALFEDADPEEYDEVAVRLRGCRASWIVAGHYEVVIPAENVLVMEGNQWNFEHARAVADNMEQGGVAFGVPSARVHRVTARDVERTQGMDDEELLYQYGLLRPWERRDIGELYAQLTDGNHRGIAALWLGDSAIVVYVSENYRENVPDDMWLRNE